MKKALALILIAAMAGFLACTSTTTTGGLDSLATDSVAAQADTLATDSL